MQNKAVPRALLRPQVLAIPLSIILASSLFFFFTRPAPALAWTRGYDTIVLVHGFDGVSTNGSSAGDDCHSTWGNVVDYLSKAHNINGQSLTWHRQDFRELSYYRGDTNCGRFGANAPTDPRPYGDSSEDLHNPEYTSHCAKYYPEGTNSSQDGTNNESLYHLSCLLDWYLNLNFSSSWNVEIVAHSMGGLIVRNGIYQVQKSKATWTMPSVLPNISDVVTLATPHGGAYGAPLLCLGCTQGGDMQPGGMFMNEMYNSAQNPQSGSTDWTMIGSQCDEAVSTSEATYMSGGHKSYFTSDSPNSCYSHGGYLTDESDSMDAHIYWCDGCTTSPSSWNYWSGAPHSLHHMMYALWLSNW